MATEMTPQVRTEADPEQGLLLERPAVVLVEQPVAAVVVPAPLPPVRVVSKGIKPFLALFQLALAVVLFGLLAYQAHYLSLGPTTVLLDDNNSTENVVGFHDEAGLGMFFFGLLFAVLMAVTAYTMWVHLTFYYPYVRHSSVVGPLKVTVAVGFIALGFACRHIQLTEYGGDEQTTTERQRIVHAIEAFIIINWIFTLIVLGMSLTMLSWDCLNLVDHRITRRMTAGFTQFYLALILIGLLAGYFQLYTEGLNPRVTTATDLLIMFGILFAVLQAMSGVAMIQQCSHHAPGQTAETIPGLLKVVLAFGVIAFGFACRSIYLTTHPYLTNWPSAHLVAIQSFVIINFIFSLFLSAATSYNKLIWDNMNVTVGKRCSGLLFAIAHLVFSIILFGLLAGLLQKMTAHEHDALISLNAAGHSMVWFGLLFAVLEFFTGITMIQNGPKKLPGLNSSVVGVTNKVTLAVGALAFGFACRHINLFERKMQQEPYTPLVHAVEAFIIINFFLTWLIDVLSVRGKILW